MTDELSPSLGGPDVPVEVPAWPLRSSDPLVIFALPPGVFERRARSTDLYDETEVAQRDRMMAYLRGRSEQELASGDRWMAR